MHVGHDVVPEFLFVSGRGGEIDVVQVPGQFGDLVIGDGQPQVLLGLREREPEPPPEPESEPLRPVPSPARDERQDSLSATRLAQPLSRAEAQAWVQRAQQDLLRDQAETVVLQAMRGAGLEEVRFRFDFEGTKVVLSS